MKPTIRAAAALACLLAGLAAAAPASADVVDDHLAAVSRGPGDVVVFGRGADGAIYFRRGIDGTWVSMGGQATSGPTATVRPDGRIEVFARGTDDGIQQATIGSGSVGPWRAVGGRSATGPGVVQRRGRNELDLFYVLADQHMVHRFSNPDGSWSAEEDLGPAVASAPAPSSRLTNYLDVFVRGTTDEIFNKSYTTTSWTPYSSVEGFTLSAPSAVVPAEGDLDIYVRGTDSELYQRHFDHVNGYTPFQRLDPTPISSGPAATVDGSRQHLFARSGNDVLVKTFDGGWSPWRSIGPVAPPPAPAPPAPAPAPVGGGSVSFGTGLSCTPRGKRMTVTIDVRKRPGRAKPRVTRVVFYYRKGKQTVARSDRTAPYKRTLPIDLASGTHRVYARIEYKRGTRKGRKTVSRRFAVCA
jgi:hypothetical protein